MENDSFALIRHLQNIISHRNEPLFVTFQVDITKQYLDEANSTRHTSLNSTHT